MERQSRERGRIRWAMTDESMRKGVVTVLLIVHGRAAVRGRLRDYPLGAVLLVVAANFPLRLPFPQHDGEIARWASNGLIAHDRGFEGVVGRRKRQKHGDAILDPFPPQ